MRSIWASLAYYPSPFQGKSKPPVNSSILCKLTTISSIISGLGPAGALGLFSGLNVFALIMVFLLVEETKRRTLEELDHIFAVSKRKFMRFQLCEYLPWLIQYRFFRSRRPRPELYEDMIWGSAEGEDLLPFRAADLLGRDSEPAVPEPVELGLSQPKFTQVEERTQPKERPKPGTDDGSMQATNNDGPVSVRY